MNLAAVVEQARLGRLYPSVILHGATADARHAGAVEVARTLLCAEPPAARPCGECAHCRRIAWPDGSGEVFHPDFQVLERDLKTATSVEATRELLRASRVSPFEARGQVFAVAAADTLTGEAADTLLKAIEEPGLGSPRHYLLLAPSRLDLPATLRSRSLAIYLGASEALPADEVDQAAAGFAAATRAYFAGQGGLYLLEAASALGASGGFEDPRAARPWMRAAAAVRQAALADDGAGPARRAQLDLAEALLEAGRWRVRGIGPDRILEGLVARHLAALGPGAATRGPKARTGSGGGCGEDGSER